MAGCRSATGRGVRLSILGLVAVSAFKFEFRTQTHRHLPSLSRPTWACAAAGRSCWAQMTGPRSTHGRGPPAPASARPVLVVVQLPAACAAPAPLTTARLARANRSTLTPSCLRAGVGTSCRRCLGGGYAWEGRKRPEHAPASSPQGSAGQGRASGAGRHSPSRPAE